MDSVKECQNVYGKTKTLLATEQDNRYGGVSDERFYHQSMLFRYNTACAILFIVFFFFQNTQSVHDMGNLLIAWAENLISI